MFVMKGIHLLSTNESLVIQEVVVIHKPRVDLPVKVVRIAGME